MNKVETEKFKRQVRDYFDYLSGYAYIKYSKKKRKYRIAISKRTWWIRVNQRKKEMKKNG